MSKDTGRTVEGKIDRLASAMIEELYPELVGDKRVLKLVKRAYTDGAINAAKAERQRIEDDKRLVV